jgi:AcrR family transcriptional regulator
MNFHSVSSWNAQVMTDNPDLERKLRRVPTQARSRMRLARVLDGADQLLASEGAATFTTTRIASAAGVPVGSVYQFFAGKDAIVEALAVRYWSDFEDLVAGVAEADSIDPFSQPVAAVADVLAAGFRARPGFLALWYGGLRTEKVRDATRPTREAIARSVERVLANHWPDSSPSDRAAAAQMVVLAGDGLLREAFRRDRSGEPAILAESKMMLAAYIAVRLGG